MPLRFDQHCAVCGVSDASHWCQDCNVDTIRYCSNVHLLQDRHRHLEYCHELKFIFKRLAELDCEAEANGIDPSMPLVDLSKQWDENPTWNPVELFFNHTKGTYLYTELHRRLSSIRYGPAVELAFEQCFRMYCSGEFDFECISGDFPDDSDSDSVQDRLHLLPVLALRLDRDQICYEALIVEHLVHVFEDVPDFSEGFSEAIGEHRGHYYRRGWTYSKWVKGFPILEDIIEVHTDIFGAYPTIDTLQQLLPLALMMLVKVRALSSLRDMQNVFQLLSKLPAELLMQIQMTVANSAVTNSDPIMGAVRNSRSLEPFIQILEAHVKKCLEIMLSTRSEIGRLFLARILRSSHDLRLEDFDGEPVNLRSYRTQAFNLFNESPGAIEETKRLCLQIDQQWILDLQCMELPSATDKRESITVCRPLDSMNKLDRRNSWSGEHHFCHCAPSLGSDDVAFFGWLEKFCMVHRGPESVPLTDYAEQFPHASTSDVALTQKESLYMI